MEKFRQTKTENNFQFSTIIIHPLIELKRYFIRGEIEGLKEWNMFAEIKKCKSRGFNKSQTQRILQIDYKTVDKYWDMTPEGFAESIKKAEVRTKKIDKYKDVILEWLQEFNDMTAAQVYDWLREKYNPLNFKERTLRLYISNLRDEYKIPKAPYIRQYEEVPELPMGYQAQVDLGQIWLKKQDRTKVKVYCFAMVLSHSRYKFLWWSDKPFTTLSFIDAHNKAFEYFGGMPEEIVYDQDKILAVSENNGDIICTEGFQKYMDIMKFKMWLCRPFDPESKGKIEAVVKFAKYNFANHRTFIDIESFNDDSFKWLERTGNAKAHEITNKVPAEVFALEKEHLKPVPQMFCENIDINSVTYTIRKNNIVLYEHNRYQVPKGTYAPGREVKLIIKDGKMDIVDSKTGEFIVSHLVSSETNKLIRIGHPERNKSKTVNEMYEKAFDILGKNNNAKILLDTIRIEKSRYCKDQFGAIINAAPNYEASIVEEALEYCIKRKLLSAGMFKDTLEYIRLQHKEDLGKKYLPADMSVPSRYKGLRPEIRSIREYINALEEDKSKWKN